MYISAMMDVMPEMKRAWSVCKGGKMEMLAMPAMNGM
jgi:hypothetical protein